ncbi:MAG: DUF6036 family nucleotidyltransferase [Planctomycetales bacterium]
MNPDFSDMLSALNAQETEYMIVGAYALAAHGYLRATGDIDIWVRCTVENAEKVLRALKNFGAPMFDLTLEDLSTPEMVFQIGLPPRRIDFLTSISGVDFDDCWADRMQVEIEGMSINFLSKSWLITNKRATGRPKDILDADELERSSNDD